MAGENDGSERDTGQQMHDTVGGDLPPAVRENLPERYAGEDLSLADDAMSATVQDHGGRTEQVTLVDEKQGDVYLLTLRDITWHQVNQALTDALVPSTSGDGKLDFGAYYRSVAESKITAVEPEVPEEQLTTWLTGLNERLGKQLQQHLPDPVDNIEEQEAKN